nr:hypothetical protein [Tanacetum cinerariifolium]
MRTKGLQIPKNTRWLYFIPSELVQEIEDYVLAYSPDYARPNGPNPIKASSKAREDDERHQESRQDRPDQIMLQQVGAIRGTANKLCFVQFTSTFVVIGQKSTGYGNVQSYITSTFIVIGQRSTGYSNVQSYITSTFIVIGQRSTGYSNVQSYITSTFIVIGQQSTRYGNVQSYITLTFFVIGQQSTGYGNVQSYITSTFIVIGQRSTGYSNVQSYI